MKRCLENSATYQPDVEPFAQGCGLLNVEEAYRLLRTYSSAPERDVRFVVLCGNNNRGVHLRGGVQDKPRDFSVTAEPLFVASFEDPEGMNHSYIYSFILSSAEIFHRSYNYI